MSELRFITPSEPIPCPVIVRSFSADPVTKAAITITGLGLYRTFLNGQRLGDDYLSPGLNDYAAYVRAQTYDITSLVQAENTLVVYLADGWALGRYGLSGRGGGRGIYGSEYLLATRITMTDAQGHTTEIHTDETWLAGASSILSSDIYDGEHRDDTVMPVPSVPCKPAAAPGPVEITDVPVIRAKATLKPTLLTSPKGESILDFGQNFAGIVRFTNRLPYGQTLRLQFGEVLQDDCFFRGNLGGAKAEYVYTSDGFVKTVEPWFTFYGFRYVLVEGLKDIDSDDFEGVVLSSDLNETMTADTSSALLNRLMRNTLWSQRSNFLDVPTDCPQRDERLGWTGDAQVFCATACYQMDSKAFFRKYLRDLRYEQVTYYDGDIPMYCPSIKGAAGPGGAAWADAATIIPWQLYQHYGDRELLKETYPLMQDYAEKLIRVDLKGGTRNLITDGFGFGDWLGLDGVSATSFVGGTDRPFIQSVYCAHSLGLTAKAAHVLGLDEDEQRFAAAEQHVRAAILNEYLTPGGRLSVDTQTGYALALYHGLYTNLDAIRTQFRNRLRLDSYRLNTGFVGTGIILPALLDHGMQEDAYRLLLREEYPGWLYPVTMGATTIWERWNSLMPDGKVSDTGMNSFNHYASGSVCEAIYSRIAGLRVLEPGWTAALIAPQPDWRLTHINVRFDSPAGVYKVSWHIQEDGAFHVEAEVPEGAGAEIVLPYHPENARHTVHAGTHAYTYQPTRSLAYPFNVDMPAMDLMAHSGARQALADVLPAFHSAMESGNQEFAMMTPRQAHNVLPFLRGTDIGKLNDALKQVRA